jgi:hypothetical protein
MLIFTGVVGSHPAGVRSTWISPTSLCTCLGNASIQVPMLDVYGTRGGQLKVVRCEILHFSVISTNRDLIFAPTTRDALTGLPQAVAKVVKRRCALILAECCSHVPFEWWYSVLCLESRYHSECWWCCSSQYHNCGTTHPSGAKYVSASFDAFHKVGRCWTGHAQDDFIPPSRLPFRAHAVIPFPSSVDILLVYRPYRPVFPQPRSLVHHKLRIT